MLQGLHHQQQQLAALPKDDSSKTAPTSSSSSSRHTLPSELAPSWLKDSLNFLPTTAQGRDHLGEVENRPEDSRPGDGRANRGYLFEGHLTVDPEPPQPDRLVRSNLLTAAATLFQGESSVVQAGNSDSAEGAVNLPQ